MTTDIERELRELFRDKAGEAPVSTLGTSGAAPQHVLRRGRRHQVGTVLGSAAVALLLAVGSFAALRSVLRDPDTFRTGDYDVFERTAAIEAFTVTSPSDWFLVNEWPLSMQIAVGSAGASGECTAAAPGAGQPSPVCTTSEQSPQVEALPHGLPMFQLSNVDMGLDAVSCGQDLPAGAAVLYVGLDYQRAIFGAEDPSIGPWPVGLPEPEAAGGPCGAGRYAAFSVNGEPFFAWVGFGTGTTDADRSTVLAAYESMTVDDAWEPVPPGRMTPAYVIAGGTSEAGGVWRLEVRPSDINVDLALVGGAQEPGTGSFTVPSIPVEWTGTDPIFGAITKAASGVEFRPGTENESYDLGGSPVPGTIVPVPQSLGSFDFDLFFIDPPAGYGELGGNVIALGVQMPTDEPPPDASPRGEDVQLSGDLLGHEWGVRFTGTFADETACIRLAIGNAQQPALCPTELGTSLAGTQPSMHVWVTKDLALFAGSVPPEVVEIRFTSDDGTTPPTQFRCRMGPLGWTDPDKKVCVLAFPPEGSGIFEYLDPNGDVLFEEGNGWGVAEPEQLAPTPVDPIHGGTYWAVYPWVGAAGDREADDVSASLLEEFGIEAHPGDLACDQGAAETLGTDAEQGIAVYFETEGDARAFALQAGLLGHEADPVIAHVTTFCLD
jgi:hypothetical protein